MGNVQLDVGTDFIKKGRCVIDVPHIALDVPLWIIAPRAKLAITAQSANTSAL